MPIRFRCVYCEQLLGIARRKAGTVVKCPNCAGQVIVPAPEAEDDSSDPESPTARADDVPVREMATVPEKTAPAPPSTAKGDGGMLFERSDFDELLKPVLERKETALAGKSARGSRKSTLPAPNTFDFNASPVEASTAAPPISPVAPTAAIAQAPAAKPRSGIVFSPLKLVLLVLCVLAGMAFAFGGGLLLGVYLGRR
jgi:hypothetical protein